jgi:hypothetical protein
MKSGIPYDYQQANCHNISHYISLLLESKGYECAKIWAFAPAVYSTSNSKLISFVDEKNISPTGTIDWRYHVAPIIEVQIGDKVRKMVIDLGLFPNEFVRYRTWLAKLKTKKIIFLIMDSDWYLYNSSLVPNSQLQSKYDELSNSNKPNIKLPDWFSDKHITDFFKYDNEASEQHWVEKGLAVNETAITFYDTEIKPILHSEKHQDLVKDYKMMVGDVFNFETIFRDKNWNFEMNNEFQTKHQDIISKYRANYAVNLKKWQQSLSLLLEEINKKKGLSQN